MADVNVSSYPQFGSGNKLMAPPDPMQQMGNAVSVAQGIQSLSQQQFELANKHLGALNNIIGSVAALPNPSLDDVTRSVTQAVQMGVLPKDAAARELTEFSQIGNDPQAIKQRLFSHLSQNMEMQQKLQAGGMAAPQMMTDNQRSFPVTVQSGLQPGISRAGGAAIPQLQSTTELATPRTIQDPTGRVTQTTQQGYQEAVGQPAKTVNDGGASPIKPGTMPGVAAAPVGNEKGLDEWSKDIAAAAPKIANTRDLAKAVQLADSLKSNATGPTAETEQRIKEFLVARAGLDPNASGVVARQELAKYLARYTASSPNAQRSDAAAAAQYQASPNISQSLPAISELAKNAIAADRMDAAMPNAFSKDAPKADYLRHKGTFMQKQDQAAYRFDFLPKAEQQRVYAEKKADLNSSDTAKKEAAEKFMRSLLTAHQTILRPE